MTTTSPNKLVQRRLNDFKRRCGDYGDAALKLAYHAALPVALNPELLHFLRINFFLDPPSPLHYTVEFEFLTSGLCREIDTELYEIEPEIRDVLLQGLSREYGLERNREVATLLWQYVEYHSPWADRVELEGSQQLTALNFLDPVKAKQWLDTAGANVSPTEGAEREWFIAMCQEIEQLPELSDTPLVQAGKTIHWKNWENEDRRQLIDLLTVLPEFATESSRRFLLELFGLREFATRLDLSGSPQSVVIEIVNYLSKYGHVRDGQEALGLFLNTLKNNMGVEQQAVLDRLLTKYQKIEPIAPSPTASGGKDTQLQKILILASTRHELGLERYIRELEKAIRRTVRQDWFEIRIRLAPHPQDMRRSIAEERPQIVHLCGHGIADGSLVLEDEMGKSYPVPPESLAALFNLHADYVSCVLLNACYSAKAAEAISQYIPYVIGMNQSIGDKAAITFAQGFYDALGYKTPDNKDMFQRAFNEGLVAIKLEQLSEGETPILKINHSMVEKRTGDFSS